MAAASATPPSLPGAPLLIVTGKGGVGRSTTATAIAVALAARGERVALVHPGDTRPAPFPAGRAGSQPAVVPVDPDRVLEAALAHELPGPLALVLRKSRGFRLVAAATPGLAELLTLAELRRLLDAAYDRIVFDAPATGHLLALLEAPGRFERAAMGGPVARRARQIGDWVLDPATGALIGVTTADPLAVAELIELDRTLRARTGRTLELVIANRLAPPAPTGAELAAALPLARAAAPVIGALAARSRAERTQLGRLTRAASGRQPLRAFEQPGEAVEAVTTALAVLAEQADPNAGAA